MIRKIIVLFFSMFFLLSCAPKTPHESIGHGISKSVIAEETGMIPTNGQTVGKVEIIGGDEVSLRNFIQRWFTPMYPLPSSDGEIKIWIERLPEKLPVEIPIPSDAQIIASVQDFYSASEVLVEINSQKDDFLALFAQSLELESWSAAPQQSQGSGFVVEADPWFAYCNDQEGAALTIQAFEISEEKTGAHLSLQTENIDYMCNPDSNQGSDQAYNMLPVLKVPAGALMTSGGSSSGDGSADSTTDIKTDLSPKVLAAHFASQLRSAGWQSLDGSSLENLAWSSWSIHDDQGEEWRGILILLIDQVNQDHVFGFIRVQKVS